MPPSVVEQAPLPQPSDLPSLSDQVTADVLPSTEWMARLRLDAPRKDVKCLTESTRLAKRITDILVSASLLVILSPLLLLVAIMVKLTSPGPIIFKQTRVGLNLRRRQQDRRQLNLLRVFNRRNPPPDRRGRFQYGKLFVLYKFRTMRTDAERAGPQFAVQNDPRVTPIGRFMRRTRLDELPQLWNVLRGEMSLVGPRPERPEFIEKLSAEIPDYLQRLGLKPGLTGVAQVVNGYDNDIEGFRRKVALDLLYLQNCCFTNDLRILLRTVRVVLTGSGAL